MADHRRVWSNEEVQCLLAPWNDVAIQRELLGMYRKAPIWRKLAEELKKRNFDCTPEQVGTKIKQLKKQYKDKIDKLRKSGVGIESGDEDDIFVNFKWFFELHAVIKRRAVVNPPTPLESSVSPARRSDTPTTEPRDSSDTLALTPLSPSPLVLSPACNEEEPQTRPECTPYEVSDITTAASTPRDTGLTTTAPTSGTTTPHQVNSTSNATMRSTTPARPSTPSTSSTSTSTSSNLASVGPSRKKRKLTKMEKADKTTTSLFEAMMKAHQGAEEKQEKMHEQSMITQEEQFKKQEE